MSKKTIRKILNIIIFILCLIAILTFLDLLSIRIKNKPLIYFKHTDEFSNQKYTGIFYDTYHCFNQSAIVTSKNKTYQCADADLSNYLIAKIESIHDEYLEVSGVINLGYLKKGETKHIKITNDTLDNFVVNQYIYGTIIDNIQINPTLLTLKDFTLTDEYYKVVITPSDIDNPTIKGLINSSSENQSIIYYSNITSILIDFGFKNYELSTAFSLNIISPEDLTKNMILENSYQDGQALMYADANYKVLVCNTQSGNKDIYIGNTSLTYSSNYCQ